MENLIVELLFPRFCIGCGYLGTYICGSCEEKMEKVKRNTCYYCEKPSLFGLTHPGCERKNGIDGNLSIYLYSGLFKIALHESKYKGAFNILKTLLSLCEQQKWREILMWKQLFNPLIMSVPLHINRLKQRGFNQSEIIAKRYELANNLVRSDYLSRVKDTLHLARIADKNIRKQQIKGAFEFVGDHIPHSIILVDDVITSGATILECAKTLKQKGVQIVLTISLAKS